MLFDVFFIEKNAKDKKHSTEENLLGHIFTMGALWSIIQTDFRNYSEGLPLLFFLFVEICHVSNLPTTQCMTLTHRIIMKMYFLTFGDTFLSDFLVTMS